MTTKAKKPSRRGSAAPRDKGQEPERRCIVTGEVRPKSELIRCVVNPDGIVVPDVDGKLPGRGLWLSASLDVVNKACAKNMFARAAKAKVRPMDDLALQIEAQLVQRCLSLIGMMRRTGSVISGYEKTRAWLKNGSAALLLAARDGAADGRSKVKALAPDLPLVELFDATELGSAVGREHVVHMALADGPLTRRFIAQTDRLNGFRKVEI